MGYRMVTRPMTSRNPQRCCDAVRSAILATAWLLLSETRSPLRSAPTDIQPAPLFFRYQLMLREHAWLQRAGVPVANVAVGCWNLESGMGKL